MKKLLYLSLYYLVFTIIIFLIMFLINKELNEILNPIIITVYILITIIYFTLMLWICISKFSSTNISQGDIIEVNRDEIVITYENGRKIIYYNIWDSIIVISDCKVTKLKVLSKKCIKLCVINCEKLKVIYGIDDIKQFYCKNCPVLEDIVGFDGVRRLTIESCIKFKSLPYFYNIKSLICDDCGINNIPNFFTLEALTLINCNYITSIPALESLVVLNCMKCPLLFIPLELRQLTGFKSKNIGINIKKYIKKFQRRYLSNKINSCLIDIPKDIVYVTIMGYL